MTKYIKRCFSVLLCLCLAVVMVNTPVSFSAADTKSSLEQDIAKLKAEAAQLQKDINNLKSQKNDQAAILSAIQKKIKNTQAQIIRCNNEINSINSKIASNQAEIDAKNQEIEDTKLAFKKRLRAIYMSNTGSNVQILLGAEDFSDFLQLSQLTASVSARDKIIINDIIDAIDVLNAKKAENESLLSNMISVKNSVQEQQKQLKAEEAEAQSIYNSIASSQQDAQKDLDQTNKDIKAKQTALQKIASGGSQYGSKINVNTGFMWPVPGHYRLSRGWLSGHYGIDINDGSIHMAPIVAIADGVIYETYNSCPHKSKYEYCSGGWCGSGWGNHIAINHGTMSKIDGAEYKAMYAHMDHIAAGMYVGKEVKQGEVIGYVGTTGWSTGYHLHFGLYRNGSWVNPSNYL